MSDDRTTRPAYVLIYAAVISLIFTGGIMALHAATRDIVERNEKLAFQEAMIELFDLGDVETLSDQQIVELYGRHISRLPDVTDPQTGRTFRLYVAVDDVDVVPAIGYGFAFSFTGTGFWARISGLLAVTPEMDTVIGIAFLQHQETPGLGGRITERDWRRKFAGLDLSPPQAGGKWIYIGGPAATDPDSPRYNRRVDAITGATGTCNAVESFLNEQIASFRRAAKAGGPVIIAPY